MDDFNTKTLHDSKNEWIVRLLNVLTPLIIEGFRSIFNESYNLCKENKEMDKYLMTFQNFITRIPKWNSVIVENEKERIIKKSRCTYLEELVTCVHIIQLKLLTAMRVGRKQRKIDIQIPKLGDFIHKCYINCAKKLYTNVYLFETGAAPMQQQKNAREIELIVRDCIMNTVRDSIPVEHILRAYMDETVEDDVVEEIIEQPIYEHEEIAKESKEGKESKDSEEIKESKISEEIKEQKEMEEMMKEVEEEKEKEKETEKGMEGGGTDSGSLLQIMDHDTLPPLDIMRIQSLSNDNIDLDLPVIELDD